MNNSINSKYLDFVVGLAFWPLFGAEIGSGDLGKFRSLYEKLEYAADRQHEREHFASVRGMQLSLPWNLEDSLRFEYQAKQLRTGEMIDKIRSGEFIFDGKFLDPSSFEAIVALAYLNVRQFNPGIDARNYGFLCGIPLGQIGVIIGLIFGAGYRLYAISTRDASS